MEKLPDRLEKDPIVEATFEWRFQGNAPAVAEILQGALYPTLKDRFPKVVRTAFADLPPALATLLEQPSLRYQPRIVLQSEHISIFIGDRSIALGCSRPYIGWKKFRPLILETLSLIKKASVVRESERISLRYINVLQGASPAEQFSLVHYQALLGRGKYKLSDYLTYTRTEILKDGLVSIVELGADSVATLPNGQIKGLVLTVDTIYSNPPDFLANPEPHIEKAHSVEKSVFFDVLTDETIAAMGPKWE